MELVHLVIDGFPHLDEGQYLEQLREYIRNRRALILKDSDTAVGVMAFHEMTGNIDFPGGRQSGYRTTEDDQKPWLCRRGTVGRVWLPDTAFHITEKRSGGRRA